MILKDLYKITKGRKAKESPDTSLQRYIQIEDLRSDFHVKYAHPNEKNISCNENDIVIAWDGANAGTVGYNLNGIIGSTLAKLTPKTDKIIPSYAGRFLQSKFKYLRDNCTGATIPHISRPTLENIFVPILPLDQQKKIVDILDNADTYRQKTKALIEKYDELTQSLFLEMFGDPVVNPNEWNQNPLSYFIDTIIDYRGKTPPKSSSGISLLSSANVHKGVIDLKHKQFISKENYKLWTVRGFTKPSDLLITTEAPVAEVALIPNDQKTYQISRRVMALRFHSNKLNEVFALHVMLNENWKNRLKQVTRGSTVPRVLKPDILCQNIIFPPIYLQNQFAERVQAVETQKVQAKASLAKAEDLFNSLLQRAFKGELTKANTYE